MTLADLLEYTRKHVLRDMAKPPMWPDDLVVRYLNEALRRIAAKTHMLVSATEELALTTGERSYELDESIVYVYSVKLDGYDGYLADLTESFIPNNGQNQRPTCYSTDRETQTISFFATPDQDYTAILRVARLPSTLSEDNLEAEVEIKSMYELLPADWVAFRCYSNPDADGFNPGTAAQAKQRWYEGISEIKHDEYRFKTGHNQRVHGRRVK